MLRVEVDMFSGRPNPTWIVTSDTVTQRLLASLKGNRSLATIPENRFQGLGFRGVEVQVIGDNDDVRAGKIPSHFVLATGAGARLKRGGELAVTLIKEMTKSAKIVLPEHALTPINSRMQRLVLSELDKYLSKPPRHFPTKPVKTLALRQTIRDVKCERCQYEISRFNPGFWNNNAFVKKNNNCYNYARNWRTDTFAQPGKASGHPNNVMQCAQVATAARFDGLVDRCRCLPASEYPRRLMALVIAPGMDYHWYRHQIGGFWGHKPGQTAARNTDNSGVVITNPETCDRGNYTNFCGYFYAGKSVKII
jgi:hypothetical protein